jgi:flagellar basal-body rod protein FlgF
MQSALYVGLSAQVALQKRVETIAHNVANITTAGYRADAVSFESVMSRAASSPVAYASSGENYISRKPGNLTATGNPLDVAVAGEGWLAYASADGPVYTRDGRMQMNPNGILQTISGRPILDAGGVPIMLDPDGGPVSIAEDGNITQDGNQMGTIGVYIIPPEAKLSRRDNSGVVPDRPASLLTTVVDEEGRQVMGGVRQGYVEGSNINPVLELTKLIMAQRTFESATAASDQSAQTIQDAVRTLGEPAKA